MFLAFDPQPDYAVWSRRILKGPTGQAQPFIAASYFYESTFYILHAFPFFFLTCEAKSSNGKAVVLGLQPSKHGRFRTTVEL